MSNHHNYYSVDSLKVGGKAWHVQPVSDLTRQIMCNSQEESIHIPALLPVEISVPCWYQWGSGNLLLRYISSTVCRTYK